jgi:hypothetical protein
MRGRENLLVLAKRDGVNGVLVPAHGLSSSSCFDGEHKTLYFMMMKLSRVCTVLTQYKINSKTVDVHGNL